MTDSKSISITAGQREAGACCSCCGDEIAAGVLVALCKDCGEVHHATCWQQRGGCSSYQCVENSFHSSSQSESVMSITKSDLEKAVPLPSPVNYQSAEFIQEETSKSKWNRLSVWAFGLALLGIPLFGLVTGIFAIVVACLALVSHTANKRGMGLAVTAIIIGILEIVGWAGALSMFWGAPQVAVSLEELPIDSTSLNDLPESIARAMRANVLIRVDQGLGRGGIGSGVILKIKNNLAYIVTNRHVIDSNYTDDTTTVVEDLDSLASIAIQTIKNTSVVGAIEWVAPSGIDLAIISAPLSLAEVNEAYWSKSKTPRIGDNVFAVGNPHGLGWTHTSGSISQIRKQQSGLHSFRVLQTSAPINPGNSGGGLYDQDGRLIGINTMTAEKRFAEGLGFSIALPILLDLVPEKFQIHSQNPVEINQ